MSSFDAYQGALDTSGLDDSMDMGHFDSFLASKPKVEPVVEKIVKKAEPELEAEVDALKPAPVASDSTDDAKSKATGGSSAQAQTPVTNAGSPAEQHPAQPHLTEDEDSEQSLDEIGRELHDDDRVDGDEDSGQDDTDLDDVGLDDADQLDKPDEENEPAGDDALEDRELIVAPVSDSGLQAPASTGASEKAQAEAAGLIWPKGLRIADMGNSPVRVKNLPDEVADPLAEQLAEAVVNSNSRVHAGIARAWAQRHSQTALVMAYMCAHLQLELDLDPSTAQVVSFFRTADPVLGAVLTRLDSLNEANSSLDKALRRHARLTSDRLGELGRTGRVAEMGLSFLLADRAENLSVGLSAAAQLPFEAKESSVLDARTVVRRASEDTHRREKDQQGREHWRK